MRFFDQWLSINVLNTLCDFFLFAFSSFGTNSLLSLLHRIRTILHRVSLSDRASIWSTWAVKMHVMSRAMCCLFKWAYRVALVFGMIRLWSYSMIPIDHWIKIVKSFKKFMGNLLIYTQSKWHSFYGVGVWRFVDSKCAISFVHALKPSAKY